MDKKKLQFVGVNEPRLLRAHPVYEIFKRGTPFQMFWHKDFGEHIPKFLCEPTILYQITRDRRSPCFHFVCWDLRFIIRQYVLLLLLRWPHIHNNIICSYIGYYTMFETIISHVEFRIILSDIIVCSRYRSYC